MTGAIVVSTTAGSKDAAEAIAQALLDRQLAACVQLSPIDSRYLWKGEIAREAEILVLIKTRAVLFQQVAAAIRAVHAYETPEIIATSITEGSADYLEWLAKVTLGEGD